MTAKTFSDAALMIRYLTIPLSKAALKIRAFGVPEL